ncbi:hypothetical protein Tco_1317955 [Tanacetum coccineum]
MKRITNDGVANNVGVNHSSQRSNARRTGTGVNVRRRNVVDRTHSNCASVTHVSPPADSNSQGGILRRLEAFVASPIGCGGSDVGIAE